MKADELLVHCYAERKDGQWQAFCLDFDLAAQADTFEEVRAKLDAMLDDYVAEATRPSGLPRQPAALRRHTLLSRRQVRRMVPLHHHQINKLQSSRQRAVYPGNPGETSGAHIGPPGLTVARPLTSSSSQ